MTLKLHLLGPILVVWTVKLYENRLNGSSSGRDEEENFAVQSHKHNFLKRNKQHSADRLQLQLICLEISTLLATAPSFMLIGEGV